MKYATVPFVFALSGAAWSPDSQPQEECCFELWAYGPAQGTLGQLTDGQVRIGGGYSPGKFCLRGNAFYDREGRGCILTKEMGQWQCDAGVTGK